MKKRIKRLSKHIIGYAKRIIERINRNRPINKGFYTDILRLDWTVHPRHNRPKLNIKRYGI